MRMWHYELINALPNNQLTGQWRECSAIIGLINKFGCPKTLLVDKVMNYPISHLISYIKLVEEEMKNRGYKTSESILNKTNSLNSELFNNKNNTFKLFEFWHSDRYFWQCYYNLQEKFDCNGIAMFEWEKIEEIANKKRLG